MVRCANRSFIEVLVELGTEGLELGTHLKQGSHDQAKRRRFKMIHDDLKNNSLATIKVDAEEYRK